MKIIEPNQINSEIKFMNYKCRQRGKRQRRLDIMEERKEREREKDKERERKRERETERGRERKWQKRP